MLVPVPHESEIEDERCESIQQILDFFGQNGSNPPSEMTRLRNRLHTSYNNWFNERADKEWDKVGEKRIAKYLRDEEGLSEIDAAKEAATIWIGNSSTYDDVYDIFIKEKENDNLSEADWLRWEYPKMSNIEKAFQIEWPSNDAGELHDIEMFAKEFEKVIGLPVNYADDHGTADRVVGEYALEPDGSVHKIKKDSPEDLNNIQKGLAGSDDTSNTDYYGLEFITPALPIATVLEHLHTVREWANEKGCRTNASCGLHMNVSLPHTSEDTLDYVKMAIFLGDKYVLDQFQRTANGTCESALEKIKDKIAKWPDRAGDALEKLKQSLNFQAGRMIHNLNTAKYTSINVKAEGSYVEVRSPGSDWLKEDIDKLTNTLYRIVFALDAACDPEKYKQEYTTKLYKLLTQNSGDVVMELFAKYASGNITLDDLKDKWALIAKRSRNQQKYNLSKQLLQRNAENQTIWLITPIDTKYTAVVIGGTSDVALEKALPIFQKAGIKVGDQKYHFQIVNRGTTLDPKLDNDVGRWDRYVMHFDSGKSEPVSARNVEMAVKVGLATTGEKIIGVEK
jgi:hypothetical protein